MWWFVGGRLNEPKVASCNIGIAIKMCISGYINNFKHEISIQPAFNEAANE